MKEVVENEVKDILLLRSREMSTEINEWLNKRATVIDNIGNYLESYNLSTSEKLIYLEFQLKNNKMFNSIYYGDGDNNMINASGWEPPASFDLRERPWYINAIASEELIITETFLNASEDDLIITIGKRIDDLENQKSVVAGDISLQELFSLVLSEKEAEKTYTYLIDEEHTILSKEFNEVMNIETKEMPYENYLNKEILKNQALDSIELVKLNGEDFYTVKRSIDSLNWSIITLIPYSEIDQPMRQLLLTFITIVIILIFLLVIIFFVIRKYIIKPLESLEEDIINVKIIPNQREVISATDKFSFKLLINKINKLLEKINDYSNRVEFEKNKYQSLFSNSNDAMVLIDSEEKIVEINDGFKELFGYSIKNIVGKDIDELIVSPEELNLSRSYNDKMKIGEKVSREAKRLDKYGKLIDVEINAVPIFTKGQYVGGFGIYRDIRKRKANEDRIKFLSFYDELTGLYNRRFYEIELKRLNNNRRLPLSLIIADVNGLKLINDAFGHNLGDKVLIKTAEVLKESSRTDDIVARLGGDEFVLLLPNTTSDAAEKIIKRINREIGKVKMDAINLSVSLGWDTKTNDNEPIETIFRNAENHMYRKKLNESPSVHGKVIQTIIHSLHEKNLR